MYNRWFPAVSHIVPEGWIRTFMHRDLVDGFVGHLDDLLPNLIRYDRIYDRDRRGPKLVKKDMGLVNEKIMTEEDLEGIYKWWNSESQSNWLDGFVRTAIMDGNGKMLKKAEKIIEERLASQDEDGYMGIFQKGQRFRGGDDTAEFWAQSTLYRGLLAYYQYSEDERVLNAVIRGVDCIMKAYPMGKSRPFNTDLSTRPWNCNATSHGLTITDTFFLLYRETKDTKYLDYAVWLYDSYCSETKLAEDIQLKNLLNPDFRFVDHAAHTMEHLRTLALAYFYGDKEEYTTAFNAYMKKLEFCLQPSGAPIGDERIRGRYADPTKVGYEYCSMQELMYSYGFIMEQSGDVKWGDRMEWLLFNAAMGAHHPQRSAITYLNTDNVYEMLGEMQMGLGKLTNNIQTRYKYSPTHQDVAVCCVPNAGKIFPYYVQSMWFTEGKRLTKALYGPSRFTHEIDGVQVQIEENSDYPYCGKLQFRVVTSAPVTFTLALRKPSWCKNYTLTLKNGTFREEESLLIIEKEWKGIEEFELNLDFEPIVHRDLLGDIYLSYGPIVMSLHIPSKEIIIKEHLVKGMYDTHHKPAEDAFWDYSITEEQAKAMRTSEDHKGLTGFMINNQTGREEQVTLYPMNQSVLRRVTFPQK